MNTNSICHEGFEQSLGVRRETTFFLNTSLVNSDRSESLLGVYEPRCEKTGFFHMRIQRRRSASR